MIADMRTHGMSTGVKKQEIETDRQTSADDCIVTGEDVQSWILIKKMRGKKTRKVACRLAWKSSPGSKSNRDPIACFQKGRCEQQPPHPKHKPPAHRQLYPIPLVGVNNTPPPHPKHNGKPQAHRPATVPHPLHTCPRLHCTPEHRRVRGECVSLQKHISESDRPTCVVLPRPARADQ
jgi:hypothetical protein